MERGSRKRPSIAGSEKMETVGGRYKKMEGHCSTGQSPQWAVAPMEEKEECLLLYYLSQCFYISRFKGLHLDNHSELDACSFELVSLHWPIVSHPTTLTSFSESPCIIFPIGVHKPL